MSYIFLYIFFTLTNEYYVLLDRDMFGFKTLRFNLPVAPFARGKRRRGTCSHHRGGGGPFCGVASRTLSHICCSAIVLLLFVFFSFFMSFSIPYLRQLHVTENE